MVQSSPIAASALPAASATPSLATRDHISVACNRRVGAAHWGRSLLAFGAHSTIALCRVARTRSASDEYTSDGHTSDEHPIDCMPPHITRTLLGHTATVNCVRFVGAVDDELLVSGSADRTVRVWRRVHDAGDVEDGDDFQCTAVLSGHDASVSAITGMPSGSSTTHTLIASVSVDGSVRLWTYDHTTDTGTCLQVMELGPNVHPLCVAMTQLPLVTRDANESHVQCTDELLAIGCTDATVRLFTRRNMLDCANDAHTAPPLFRASLTLRGHADWVRALAFTHTTGEDVLLASGSQDKYIRLWRVSSMSARAVPATASSAKAAPLDANGEVVSKSNGSTALFQSLPADMLASLQESLREHGGGVGGGGGESSGSSAIDELTTKPHTMNVGSGGDDALSSTSYSVFLDAVLMGHDDWVLSLEWKPLSSKANASMTLAPPSGIQPTLLSSSADKTMMIWRPDADSGVWVNDVSLGDLGGCALGVYGALWSPCGRIIAGQGYHGVFHIWREVHDRRDDVEDCGDRGIATSRWEPCVGISGHYAPVKQIAWDPTNTFLLSTSHDQTTRLWAPWNHRREISANGTSTASATPTTLHEIGRPQIHGYDLQCIAFTHPYRFASGAEGEKVVRVFDAPRSLVDMLEGVSGRRVKISEQRRKRLPAGAALPPLGLSNKTVVADASTANNDGGDPLTTTMAAYAAVEADRAAVMATSSVMANSSSSTSTSATPSPQRPPFEQHLQQYTLWPESEKLYGHGFEIFALAASHDGRILASASACRAGGTSVDAAVRLWDVREGHDDDVGGGSDAVASSLAGTWRESQQPLESHSLTVTCLRFSWNDRYLLSAGRDRMWSLFERIDDGEVDGCADRAPQYRLASRQAKAHARIIWDAAWSHCDSFFVTASRDKTVKVWTSDAISSSPSSSSWTTIATLKFNEGVTSVALAPVPIPSDHSSCPVHLLAVGLESGAIYLYESGDGRDWLERSEQLARKRCHAAAVTSMAWRVTDTVDGSRWVDGYDARVFVDRGVGADAVGTRLELATASDDHSVRILHVALQ